MWDAFFVKYPFICDLRGYIFREHEYYCVLGRGTL